MHDQPKILSKVITRFESKVGLERHFLRWTTRKSQDQSREAAGLTKGGKCLQSGLNAWDAAIDLIVRTSCAKGSLVKATLLP